MLRSFFKAKLRDIAITSVNADYEGSIKLDEDYMDRAGILPWEQVHVLNYENGVRFTTYAITGRRGSGVVELNGPAASCGKAGDRIMVLAYCLLSAGEIRRHMPKVVRIHPKKKK